MTKVRVAISAQLAWNADLSVRSIKNSYMSMHMSCSCTCTVHMCIYLAESSRIMTRFSDNLLFLLALLSTARLWLRFARRRRLRRLCLCAWRRRLLLVILILLVILTTGSSISTTSSSSSVLIFTLGARRPSQGLGASSPSACRASHAHGSAASGASSAAGAAACALGTTTLGPARPQQRVRAPAVV